ncbi:MAG: type II toxin-antitoxin system RelE/ParE family toxin [Defluviitaleaceae bacterium]|nr:type II toxin-antitoxin system RelE/ParE family toxin [Defluviitaleaceae bacterium]
MTKYKVSYSTNSQKNLRRIDHFQRERIIKWVRNNLEDCTNPRDHGKQLKGHLSHLWSYRVGNYRIVAEIIDNIVTIQLLEIDHRKDAY